MKEDEILDIQSARKIIREINGLNLQGVDFEELKRKINSLLYCSYPAGRLDIGRQFYRANKIEEGKPTNVARISYPPADKVTDFQRCNAPNKPVFYCADDQITSLFEVRPEHGDTLYLSTWTVIHPFLLLPLGAPVTLTPASDVVATFLEGKFIQEIHETFSYQYKVTAAVTEIFFSESHKLIAKKSTPEGVTPYGLCAISYASAADPEHKRSYAIRPVAVDDCMKLDWVIEVQVEAVRESDTRFTCTAKSSRVLDDGTIEWA